MQNKEKVINGINYLVGSNCRCSVRMSLYFIVTKKKKEKKKKIPQKQQSTEMVVQRDYLKRQQ
jgi:hypothetical protein